ncbi:MAG: hypothetical protein ACK4N4_08625, partial [Burkholderiales bacterium]
FGFCGTGKRSNIETSIPPMEVAMVADDAHGSDPDRFFLEQETDEDEPPELGWDETDVQTLASELIGRRPADS